MFRDLGGSIVTMSIECFVDELIYACVKNYHVEQTQLGIALGRR